jgi:hypothetical protein
VDFSAATARQVAMAAELSRVFGARLILHHNLTTTPLGAGVGWMYASEVSRDFAGEDEVETRLQHVIEQLPAGVAASACVTRGLPWTAVVKVAAEPNWWCSPPRRDQRGPASVTEQVLERPDALLVARDGDMSAAFSSSAARECSVPTDCRARHSWRLPCVPRGGSIDLAPAHRVVAPTRGHRAGGTDRCG